jgi:hypothetical protein
MPTFASRPDDALSESNASGADPGGPPNSLPTRRLVIGHLVLECAAPQDGPGRATGAEGNLGQPEMRVGLDGLTADRTVVLSITVATSPSHGTARELVAVTTGRHNDQPELVDYAPLVWAPTSGRLRRRRQRRQPAAPARPDLDRPLRSPSGPPTRGRARWAALTPKHAWFAVPLGATISLLTAFILLTSDPPPTPATGSSTVLQPAAATRPTTIYTEPPPAMVSTDCRLRIGGCTTEGYRALSRPGPDPHDCRLRAGGCTTEEYRTNPAPLEPSPPRP